MRNFKTNLGILICAFWILNGASVFLEASTYHQKLRPHDISVEYYKIQRTKNRLNEAYLIKVSFSADNKQFLLKLHQNSTVIHPDAKAFLIDGHDDLSKIQIHRENIFSGICNDNPDSRVDAAKVGNLWIIYIWLGEETISVEPLRWHNRRGDHHTMIVSKQWQYGPPHDRFNYGYDDDDDVKKEALNTRDDFENEIGPDNIEKELAIKNDDDFIPTCHIHGNCTKDYDGNTTNVSLSPCVGDTNCTSKTNNTVSVLTNISSTHDNTREIYDNGFLKTLTTPRTKILNAIKNVHKTMRYRQSRALHLNKHRQCGGVGHLNDSGKTFPSLSRNMFKTMLHKRMERATLAKANKAGTECDMLALVDFNFFKHFDLNPTMVIYALAINYRYADDILRRTNFTGASSCGIVIREFRIHTAYSKSETYTYNAKNIGRISAEQLLTIMRKPSNDSIYYKYCLVHLNCKRDFEPSVAGLAYWAETSSWSAGICGVYYAKRNNPSPTNLLLTQPTSRYNFDLLGYSLVVTHEIGHSWGSDHDKGKKECEGQDRGFLMNPLVLSSEEHKHASFSPCSFRQISTILKIRRKECFLVKDWVDDVGVPWLQQLEMYLHSNTSCCDEDPCCSSSCNRTGVTEIHCFWDKTKDTPQDKLTDKPKDKSEDKPKDCKGNHCTVTEKTTVGDEDQPQDETKNKISSLERGRVQYPDIGESKSGSGSSIRLFYPLYIFEILLFLLSKN